jgi:uncharacterized protein YjdB
MKKNLLWICVAACLSGCDADTEEQKEVRVSGVKANTETLALEIGRSETLEATVSPENATVKRFSWESANANIVTVDNNGLVTAVGKGSTDIIVKTPRDGFTDTIKVTVIVRASGVAIDRPSMSVKVGSNVQMTATVLPADASDKSVTWSVANEAIATVTPDGVVTGIAEGKTGITATTIDGGFTANAEVTVLAADIPVSGVTLNKSSVKFFIGFSERLTVAITPADATNQTVFWKSANTAVSSINAAGTVVGIAEGKTHVTAETEDGGFTATAEVIVANAEGAYEGIVKMNGNQASTAPIACTVTFSSATTFDIDAKGAIAITPLPLHVHGVALEATLLSDGSKYMIKGNAMTDNFGYGDKPTTFEPDSYIDADGNIYLHLTIESITEKVEYIGKKK